jgi:hypothetical protein
MKRDFKSAVREHFKAKMCEEINRLAAFATYDLHFGPYPEGTREDDFEYPGWATAADKLQSWAEEHLCSLWIGDETDNVLESEPEPGYYDDEGVWVEEWESYYHLSLREVAQAFWNRELVNHIWL